MTEPIKSQKLLQSIIHRIFCTHEYQLVNHYVIDSEFDIVDKSGRTPNSHCSLKRKYIWDYKCNKCQKIKRLDDITCS